MMARILSRDWPGKGNVLFYHCQFHVDTALLFYIREGSASRYLTDHPDTLENHGKANGLWFHFRSPPKNCYLKSQLFHLSISNLWDSYILNSYINIFLAEKAAIRKFCQATNPKGCVLISFCEKKGKQYLNAGNFQFYKYMQIKHDDDVFCNLKILN